MREHLWHDAGVLPLRLLGVQKAQKLADGRLVRPLLFAQLFELVLELNALLGGRGGGW